MANLPTGRRIVAIAAVILLAWPLLLRSSFYINLGVQFFLFICLVTSWNIMGYTGYINFGHVAFYGTGMYVAALLTTMTGLPFPVAVIGAGIAAGLFGYALGLFSLRITGPYFGLVSLLFVLIASVLFGNISDLVPGAETEMTLPLWSMDIVTFRTVFYYIFLAYAVAIVVFSIWLENSKYGFGMLAIKNDEDIAVRLGVGTYRLKNVAIVISAFISGIIGGTHMQYIGYLDVPVAFSLATTFLIVFVGYIGGMGSWYGPVLGVLLFKPIDMFLTIFLPSEVGNIIFGLVFVATILIWPGGLASLSKEDALAWKNDLEPFGLAGDES